MSNITNPRSKEIPGDPQPISREKTKQFLPISVKQIDGKDMAVSKQSPTEMFLQGHGARKYRYVGGQYVLALVFDQGQEQERDPYWLSLRQQTVKTAGPDNKPWNAMYYRYVKPDNSFTEIPLVYINSDQRLKKALKKNPYAIAAGVVFLMAVASCAFQTSSVIARFTPQSPIGEDGPGRTKTPRTTTPESATARKAAPTTEPTYTATQENTTIPPLTQPTVLPSEAVSNQTTLVVCPLPDGRAITLSVIGEETSLPKKALTNPVPDEDRQLLRQYHQALSNLGLTKNQVAVCLSDGTGLSDVVAVYEIVEEKSNGQGKTILLEKDYLLYVYDGQTESFVKLTNDQTFSPETKWLQTELMDGSFFASQFSTGKRGEENFFDGVMVYKIDDKLGETIYAVITQGDQGKPTVYTGNTMWNRFSKALERVDGPLFTYENIPDGILSDPENFFGYEQTTGENGRTALKIVIRAKNGVIVWPVSEQEAESINQSIKTNNIFIELMASYDEKTQQGTIEIKNKDGKVVETVAVTLSPSLVDASSDTPDFVYAYSNDGTRVFVFNEKNDGFVVIPVEKKVKIKKIKNENVDNRDTKEKEWQLSDGIFYYDKESKRWLSAPGIHIKTGENWKTRNQDIVKWANNVKITGFSKTDEEKIRSVLIRLAPMIVKVPLPPFVVSKDPNIRNEPLMKIDPGAFFLLVGEIRAKSTGTASADWNERNSGIVDLNLRGILGNWSEDFLQFFIVNAIVKEASVIALGMLVNENPCLSDKQSPGTLTRTEVEWGSVYTSVEAYLALAKAYPERKDDFLYIIYGPKKDDPAFKDNPKKYAEYYKYSLRYLFENPEAFPQCGR